ncbi:Translocon-associated protein subunit delta [Plecturocebus cupreus]
MVATASLGALALLLLSGLSRCSAEACMEPQITPSYYTTSDAVISTETVFIVEISLTCKNRVQGDPCRPKKNKDSNSWGDEEIGAQQCKILASVARSPSSPALCAVPTRGNAGLTPRCFLKVSGPGKRAGNMALYADVGGKQFPVTRGQDVGRYQGQGPWARAAGELRCRHWEAGRPSVSTLPTLCTTHPTQVSWSLDHKSAHAGTYEVRFFDEESYSLLRKVRTPAAHCTLLCLGSRMGWVRRRWQQVRARRPSCAPVPSLRQCLSPISLLSFSGAWTGVPACLSSPRPTLAARWAALSTAPPLQAQRNNEDVSIISPLFTVSVDHRGTWNGPWVSTEVLAAAIGLVIYYLAFSAKTHIQA